MLTGKNTLIYTFRFYTSVLVFIISILALQSEVFADTRSNLAEEYRVKGYIEQQKGNFNKALSFYTKALSLTGENPVVLNDMGVISEQTGQIDQAETYYLQAIKVNEQYLPPYANLAYLYKQKRDLTKATYYFKERIKRAPKGDPWVDKAKLELIQINPELPQELFLEQFDRLSDENFSKDQEELLLSVSRANEHFQKGQRLIAKKKYKEGIREYDRALAITPDNPIIIKARRAAAYEQTTEEIKRRSESGMQFLKKGEVKAAKVEFQKILSLIPNEAKQNSEKNVFNKDF